MSRVPADVIEAKRDDVIPAKVAGFGEISVKIDLAGFDNPAHTLMVEAFADNQRIAYMEAQGGPRPTTTIAGDRIANPDLLVFVTGSNREHKGAIRVTTTIKGDTRAKTPLEAVTR